MRRSTVSSIPLQKGFPAYKLRVRGRQAGWQGDREAGRLLGTGIIVTSG